MDDPRPSFIWLIVIVVTVVFAILYVSLPETIEAVETRRGGLLFHREPRFRGKQVNQRPLLIGVWLAIVVPLTVWSVVVTRRESG